MSYPIMIENKSFIPLPTDAKFITVRSVIWGGSFDDKTGIETQSFKLSDEFLLNLALVATLKPEEISNSTTQWEKFVKELHGYKGLISEFYNAFKYNEGSDPCGPYDWARHKSAIKKETNKTKVFRVQSLHHEIKLPDLITIVENK